MCIMLSILALCEGGFGSIIPLLIYARTASSADIPASPWSGRSLCRLWYSWYSQERRRLTFVFCVQRDSRRRSGHT